MVTPLSLIKKYQRTTQLRAEGREVYISMRELVTSLILSCRCFPTRLP